MMSKFMKYFLILSNIIIALAILIILISMTREYTTVSAIGSLFFINTFMLCIIYNTILLEFDKLGNKIK